MMSKMMFIFIVLILASEPLAYSQQPGQPGQPAPQGQPGQPAKPPEEPPSPLAVPKDYHYSGGGRRDPFVNPVPKPAPTPGNAIVARLPNCPQGQGLKGVLVGQAALAGIVTSREPSMTVAVISAPGGKTYFARIGDALCDAVVKNIKLDMVTFLPNTPPGTDPKNVRSIDRKLRPAPGDGK